MASAPKPAAYYLEKMTGFAKKLKDSGINPTEWAARKRYVRVNGGGLRPISLCHVSPCGALVGFKTRENTRGLKEAINAPIPRPDYIRKKPEHRVQAALIEHALRWPVKVPEFLHLQDECDEIRFVTDEFKIEDIRADVVMIGFKSGVWFPIFIELKAIRSKTEVVGQVLKIKEKVSRLDTALSFIEFVKTASDIKGDVDLRKSIVMIVWPAAQGRPLSLDETLARGIRVLEFERNHEFAKSYDEPKLSFASKC